MGENGKNYVLGLWKLSRKLYPERFSAYLPKGRAKAFQSHSIRSAWIFKPWSDGKRWYPGIEYKGVGEGGKPVRDFAGVPWGGVWLREARAEHAFAKAALKGGAFCQRPVAVHRGQLFKGKRLGIVARAFVSPLRLSDFMFEKKLFSDYLSLRKESRKDYAAYLGRTLGASVRMLFDAGIFHGSMGVNNITSEGEIADFEPTYGGTREGLMWTKEPGYRLLALNRIVSGVGGFFGAAQGAFLETFASSFLGRRWMPRRDFARGLLEKYEGRKLGDAELAVQLDDGGNTAAAIEGLKQALKEVKDPEILKRVRYALKGLGQ